MSKLFAPIIDSKLIVTITQYIDDNNELEYWDTEKTQPKCKISFPYKKSLGVGYEDYQGYIKIKFKSVPENKEISSTIWGSFKDNNTVTCTIPQGFKLGDYGKIQIAFVKDYIDSESPGVTGYFSNVGVFRCVITENIYITPRGDLSFKGRVSFGEIAAETVIKERYTAYNDNVLLESSDWLVGNYGKWWKLSYLPKFSPDEATLVPETENQYMPYNLKIVYEGYSSSNIYFQKELNIQFTFLLDTDSTQYFKYDKNEAYIYFPQSGNNLQGYFAYKINKNESKMYLLGDYSGLNRDYNIEQGITYEYGIYYNEQYNTEGEEEGFTVQFILMGLSESTFDFEDILIYDGEKQLKLSYNPKVSSYKTNVLETKTNTLGGRYPFIFRNGDVNYKEFQISGLLSVLLDNNGDFIEQETTDELTRQKTAAGADEEIVIAGSRTDLTADNIYQERLFKTAVYDWFTNGKPKLLRTPTEGNFIVRFMDVSMTPNDQLGRMLHTINATAVEIDECSNENLKKYGLM